jgi:hypothetical protein
VNAGTADAPTGTPTPGDSAQVFIYAIPLSPTSGPMHGTLPGPDGSFSIPNIAPGSYRVVACDAPQQIEYHIPEGLAVWATKGQTVTVDPSGTAHVTLDVIHVETTP